MADKIPAAKPATASPAAPPKPAPAPSRAMSSLQSVAALAEAMSEHVPPTTRRILQDSINVHLQVLQEELAAKA